MQSPWIDLSPAVHLKRCSAGPTHHQRLGPVWLLAHGSEETHKDPFHAGIGKAFTEHLG